MDHKLDRSSRPESNIPPDNLQRQLTVVRPNEDQKLPHIGLVGDTYTILLTGEETNGRYCLIDMHIPPGGLEEFFDQWGVRASCRTTLPPKPDKDSLAAFQAKAQTLAPKYRTELLGP